MPDSRGIRGSHIEKRINVHPGRLNKSYRRRSLTKRRGILARRSTSSDAVPSVSFFFLLLCTRAFSLCREIRAFSAGPRAPDAVFINKLERERTVQRIHAALRRFFFVLRELLAVQSRFFQSIGILDI